MHIRIWKRHIPQRHRYWLLYRQRERIKAGHADHDSEVSDLLTGQTQLTGNVTFTRAELDGKDYLKSMAYQKEHSNCN